PLQCRRGAGGRKFIPVPAHRILGKSQRSISRFFFGRESVVLHNTTFQNSHAHQGEFLELDSKSAAQRQIGANGKLRAGMVRGDHLISKHPASCFLRESCRDELKPVVAPDRVSSNREGHRLCRPESLRRRSSRLALMVWKRVSAAINRRTWSVISCQLQ